MLSILLVCANPRGTDQLRTAMEERRLRESVQLSKYRKKIKVISLHAATIDDLRRALLNDHYDVVHFSGHGTGSGLVFEDESGDNFVPPPAALAALLARRGVRAAVLNACHSISVGSLASSSLEYTIAVEGPIADDGAVEFSRGFYDALGAGREPDEAFHEGLSCAELKGTPVQAVILKGTILTQRQSSGADSTQSRAISVILRNTAFDFNKSYTVAPSSTVGTLLADLSRQLAGARALPELGLSFSIEFSASYSNIPLDSNTRLCEAGIEDGFTLDVHAKVTPHARGESWEPRNLSLSGAPDQCDTTRTLILFEVFAFLGTRDFTPLA